jgi:hypothetical protein
MLIFFLVLRIYLLSDDGERAGEIIFFMAALLKIGAIITAPASSLI